MKIENNDIPALCIIPLSQGNTKPSLPVVKIGDAVQVGQLLGKCDGDNSLNIFSSVAGRVVALDFMMNTCNGMVKSVLIQTSESQSQEAPTQVEPVSKQNIVDLLYNYGLLSYTKNALTYDLSQAQKSETQINLGITLFDEFMDIDLQNHLFLENADNVVKSIDYVADILEVSCIKVFFNQKDNDKNKIIDSIKTNSKHAQKIEFVDIKFPNNKNNYDYFNLFCKKNNYNNLFCQTISVVLDIYNALNLGIKKIKKTIYIGGSATKQNNGYLEILNGTTLEHLKKMCGGLVFEEQELDDLKSDIADCIDDKMDAYNLFKKENDKQKRKQLKKSYIEQKRKTSAKIWEYIKNQRANLNKTIKQICINSKKYGQTFGDFAGIIDFSEDAVFFLNRLECK